jgi:hypothetical protein
LVRLRIAGIRSGITRSYAALGGRPIPTDLRLPPERSRGAASARHGRSAMGSSAARRLVSVRTVV